LQALRHGALAGAGAGALFAGWEGLLDRLAPGLAGGGSLPEHLLALLGTAVLGALAALLAPLLGRDAVRSRALLLLAALLAPQLLRPLERHQAWDLACAALLLLLAWRLPRPGALLGVLVLALLPPLELLCRDRGGAGPASQAGPLPQRPLPDMALITVDTLRADQRFALPQPQLWRSYEQAVSPSPWTLPAMQSLFTGLPVARHGGGLPLLAGGHSLCQQGLAWLPELLAQQGYATLAAVSNPYLGRDYEFDRGFSVFVHSDAFREPHLFQRAWQRWRFRLTGRVQRLRHARDRLLTDAALAAWQRAAGRPRFLWLHLLSPHEYSRDPARSVPGWHPGVEDLSVLRRAYRANIDSAEEQVARLLAGLGEQVLVAFTADHGEAFGEPGYRGHGKGLNDAELRVPLALRGPGVQPGRVEDQVSGAALGDQLLRLAGLEPLLPGGPLAAADAVAVGGLRRLPADSPQACERVFGLRRAGGGYAADPQAQQRCEQPRGQAGQLSEETRESLRALGYVEE